MSCVIESSELQNALQGNAYSTWQENEYCLHVLLCH